MDPNHLFDIAARSTSRNAVANWHGEMVAYRLEEQQQEEAPGIEREGLESIKKATGSKKNTGFKKNTGIRVTMSRSRTKRRCLNRFIVTGICQRIGRPLDVISLVIG